MSFLSQQIVGIKTVREPLSKKFYRRSLDREEVMIVTVLYGECMKVVMLNDCISHEFTIL